MFMSGYYGGYGVAVARELVELSVRVRLPVATQFDEGWFLTEPNNGIQIKIS